MNQREIALFLAFYFYLLNVATANDAQRVILLSCITQTRALQAQIFMLNERRSTALACTSPAHREHYLRRYPKRENLSEKLNS